MPLSAAQDSVAGRVESGEQLFVLVADVDKTIDQQLEELLLTLFNTDSLAVRLASVDRPDPTEFARARGLLSGSEIGLKLASLLCDLNPDPCSRERVLIKAKEEEAPAEHILYTRPSTTRWVWSKTKELLVPAIEVRSNTTWIFLDVKPTLPLSKVVVDVLGGCHAYDDKCKSKIAKFNALVGDRVFEESYAGPISLPAQQLEVRTNITKTEDTWEAGPDVAAVTFVKLYVPPRAQSEPRGFTIYKTLFPLAEQKLILRTIYDRVGTGPASYATADGPVPPKKEELLQDLDYSVSARELAVDELKQTQSLKASNTLEKSQVQGLERIPFGNGGPSEGIATPRDIEKEQARLLRMLSFPYNRLTDLPNVSRPQKLIAVLDYWFDPDHCALSRPNVEIRNKHTNEVLRSQPNRSCDSWHASNSIDHGTHILGLISGRAPDDRLWGLNPFAKVVAIEVPDLSRDENAEDFKKEVIDLIDDREPKIINMSWGGYGPSSNGYDPLEKVMQASYSANILVVTAAGNERRNLSLICDVRPACYDLPNVLAVAALDDGRPPKLMDDTNYGSRVHIAAPGDKIYSTVTRGSFGTMSGSSQAAALVTGTASLLMAANRNLKGIQVRNRLIVCSRLMWGPDVPKLVGGMLDPECTLNGETGWLERDKQPILRAEIHPSQKSIMFRYWDGPEVPISTDQLKGFQQDLSRARFSVFLNSRLGDSNSGVTRLDNLVLDEGEQKLLVVGPEGPVEVRVADITRYVAPWEQ
jgi:hypothetical protein